MTRPLTSPPPQRWEHYLPGTRRAWLRRDDIKSRIEQRASRAAAERIKLLDLKATPGSSWFPTALEDNPSAYGFLFGISTRQEARDVPAPQAILQEVRSWLAKLLGEVDPDLLELPSLFLRNMPPDVRPTGRSWGLAAAAAVISHLLQTTPKCAVLCSAKLGLDGKPLHLESVGKREEKRMVFELEAPEHDDYLICDTEGSAKSQMKRWFGDAWLDELRSCLDVSPHALARLARLSYEARDYQRAQMQAEAAQQGNSGHSLALALWTHGACLMHGSEHDEALHLLQRADDLLAEPPLDDDPPPLHLAREELEAFTGIALLDNGRPSVAVARLEAALERIEETARGRRLTHREAFVAVQVAGTLHRNLLLLGRSERAIEVLEHWSLGRALLPQEEARCRGDLAEVHRRRGERALAETQWKLACRALARSLPGQRTWTRRYQRIFLARSSQVEATWPIAPPAWKQWPQPLEVTERLLQESVDKLNDWMVERALPSKRTLVHDFLLCAVAARADFDWPQVPAWLPELAGETISKMPDDESGVIQALEKLAAGDPRDWTLRAPY